MIVIGADTHKRTHALAAVDVGDRRGRRASVSIGADELGHLSRAALGARALRASACGRSRTAGMSRVRLEQALFSAGERVIRVPPQLMGAAPPRRARVWQVRSDRRARRRARRLCARASSASPSPSSTSARWRSACSPTTASDLVAERTRAQNRLRWHLRRAVPASWRPGCRSARSIAARSSIASPASSRRLPASVARVRDRAPARQLDPAAHPPDQRASKPNCAPSSARTCPRLLAEIAAAR